MERSELGAVLAIKGASYRYEMPGPTWGSRQRRRKWTREPARSEQEHAAGIADAEGFDEEPHKIDLYI